MTRYAAVTKIVVKFLKTSTIADTKIDTELAMKRAYKQGFVLLGDLIIFKLIDDVSPDFVDKLEIQIINKMKDLEECALRCRKLRARERRVYEESQKVKCVTVSWVLN